MSESKVILPQLERGAEKTTEQKMRIVHGSEVMENLMTMVSKVAPSSAAVLILGESGTGKELVAKRIHEESKRSDKPFVAINCGALRETLLESELFGHERGAFTGAYNRKIGLAEVADGGTLFLDEVGELSPTMQAKLLRFFQEGEIFRVGGKSPIKVNIRLISATNRELDTEVVNGVFREDLFYRINTISLKVPPLRARKEDIASLVDHFMNKVNTDSDKSYQRYEIDDEAMKFITSYDWPGNVRELQNLCERLKILSESHTIMLGDLPKHILNPQSSGKPMNSYDPTVTLYDLEKTYILNALEYFDKNKTKAAKALGITIKTLYNKLHAYEEFENYAIHSKSGSES